MAVAAWVVLEIWLLVLVAEAFGGLTVFLLLVAGVLLGGYATKRAGRRAWRRLADNVQAAQRGRPAAVADAAEERGGNTLAMVGGVLLIVPGLLSDVAALLCLFPPTRALLRGYAERSLERRMRKAGVPGGPFGAAYQQTRTGGQDDRVVPGEVIREDEPRRDDSGSGRSDPPLPGG